MKYLKFDHFRQIVKYDILCHGQFLGVYPVIFREMNRNCLDYYCWMSFILRDIYITSWTHVKGIIGMNSTYILSLL